MRIDRSNYEIWLIDWLDGNLSKLREEELVVFLQNNPDLQEEFKDLSAARLSPAGSSYKRKNLLLRTPSEISDSQFGLLCVGYLENDLTENQKSELLGITGNDSARKAEFELIQKIKLSQPEISYKNKDQLLKTTVFQKAISLSLIGLSAAAAIALLILFVPFSPEKGPGNPLTIAEAVNKDTSVISIKRETPPDNASQEKIKTGKPSGKRNILQTNNTVLAESAQVIIPVTNDTLKFSREEEINKVYFSSPININRNGEPLTLIASSASVDLPYYDDGRSKISRLIARTFRDKILKEDISKDTPLKGYEIAEAGVTGLNKLLGWDMAIDKNNDINGELNSVYFSSKILKFNTPVKKTEPSE